MIPSLDLGFFITAYAIMIFFFVIQQRLRKTPSAKSFKRGEFEKGSMPAIGSAVGIGMILPLILNLLGIESFNIGVATGIFGLFIMLCGLGLRIWAALTMGKYYTVTLKVDVGQNVVTSGPYSRIRHPGYTGEILLWLGFAILIGNRIALIFVPLMFLAVFLYRISVEESMLIQELNGEYLDYRKKTRKLVPYVY